MNKYRVSYAGDAAMTIDADGFQIGPNGAIIFIEKGEKGEVNATHYISDVKHISKQEES